MRSLNLREKNAVHPEINVKRRKIVEIKPIDEERERERERKHICLFSCHIELNINLTEYRMNAVEMLEFYTRYNLNYDPCENKNSPNYLYDPMDQNLRCSGCCKLCKNIFAIPTYTYEKIKRVFYELILLGMQHMATKKDFEFLIKENICLTLLECLLPITADIL